MKKTPESSENTTHEYCDNLKLVLMDFIHLVKSRGGHNYIFLVMEHFTCYSQAGACRNNSARTAAENIFGNLPSNTASPLNYIVTLGGNVKTS